MARADSSVIISRFHPRVNPFFNLFLTLFESFSSKSGFLRGEKCIFLDIAGKMQSLSLLRLIEKFAEIHRQVSLCSLTAVGLGVLRCSFRFEPVSIAECSAFCAETTFLFKWSYVGLPPKPAWGFTPNPSREHRSLHPLSAARGSQAGNQKIAYSFFSYCFSIASICALAAFCAS